VLRAFGKNDPPLRNQELARRTGLPRPTISRITHTLTELGFLSYREQMGCYELGGSTVVLGNVARSNISVVTIARPFMESMADLSKANVGLGGRERLAMVYLEVYRGEARVSLNFDVGARIPMFETAMGRAYLACAPDEEVTELLDQLHNQCEHELRDAVRTIERARKEYHRDGFCASVGEWNGAIHGVAAPIVMKDLSSSFVLNCGAPAYLLPKEKLLGEIGPMLAGIATEVSGALESLLENSGTGQRDQGPIQRSTGRRRPKGLAPL